MFLFSVQFGRPKADNSGHLDTIVQAAPLLGALAPIAARWIRRHQRGKAPADIQAAPQDIQPGGVVASEQALQVLKDRVEILTETVATMVGQVQWLGKCIDAVPHLDIDVRGLTYSVKDLRETLAEAKRPSTSDGLTTDPLGRTPA